MDIPLSEAVWYETSVVSGKLLAFFNWGIQLVKSLYPTSVISLSEVLSALSSFKVPLVLLGVVYV